MGSLGWDYDPNEKYYNSDLQKNLIDSVADPSDPKNYDFTHDTFGGYHPGAYDALTPKTGEGIDQFLARLDKASTGPDGKPVPNSKLAALSANIKANRSKYEALWQNPNGAPLAKPPPTAQQPGGYEQQMQDFYKLMMNPNAPELQRARMNAAGAASRDSEGRGLRGGLSQMGIERAGADAYNQSALQRQGLGFQALAGAANHNLGLSAQGLQQQAMLFDQNQSNQINNANQQRAMMQAATAFGGQAVGLVGDIAKSGIRNQAQNSYNPNDYSGSNYNTPGFDQGFGPGGSSGGSDPSAWNNPY